jgi:hypothetical protein
VKAFLMFRDHDFEPAHSLPSNAADLMQDLEMQTVVDAMARGDQFLADIANTALLCSLDDPDDIRYRQGVLRDCLTNEHVVREIYDLAVEAITRERKIYGWMSDRYPAAILQHAIEVLEMSARMLHMLRTIAEEHSADFSSEGFGRFFRMLPEELDDAYFSEIDAHLRRLRLRDGVLISARLDANGKGADLVMRRQRKDKQSLGERLYSMTHPAPSFRIAERDEAGANALAELHGRGISLVADALARSTDHIMSFFQMLRNELGFYVGCVNMHETLAAKGEPTAFPSARAASDGAFTCSALYDVSLALLSEERVVGNTVTGDGRRLVIITGANRGGKSTFLRSVGLAQVMAQCGMFVGAEGLETSVAAAIFTHFKREEDTTMSSGKLDEELARMSDIADVIVPRSIILFNESFASTNEREGSEIGRQVVRAMLDSEIRVFFVTHQYDLAHRFQAEYDERTLFLRADRDRTFALTVGEPLPTSFGGDLYLRIFGQDVDVAGAAV